MTDEAYAKYMADAYIEQQIARDRGIKATYHKIVRANDLKEVVTQDVSSWLFSSVANDYHAQLRTMFGDDDTIAEAITGAVERAIRKAWQEMEFEIIL